MSMIRDQSFALFWFISGWNRLYIKEHKHGNTCWAKCNYAMVIPIQWTQR